MLNRDYQCLFIYGIFLYVLKKRKHDGNTSVLVFFNKAVGQSRFCKNHKWIVVSSIPFWVGHHAAIQRPWGSNLNLPATITWLGRMGMCLDELD